MWRGSKELKRLSFLLLPAFHLKDRGDVPGFLADPEGELRVEGLEVVVVVHHKSPNDSNDASNIAFTSKQR